MADQRPTASFRFKLGLVLLAVALVADLRLVEGRKKKSAKKSKCPNLPGAMFEQTRCPKTGAKIQGGISLQCPGQEIVIIEGIGVRNYMLPEKTKAITITEISIENSEVYIGPVMCPGDKKSCKTLILQAGAKTPIRNLMFMTNNFVIATSSNQARVTIKFVCGRKLLALLVDGFRHDYLKHASFANLRKYISYPKGMKPVFPPVSYTNWQTISTGRYAEGHGILGNEFLDKATGAVFDLENNGWQNPLFWQGAETFEATATRQGKKVSFLGSPSCMIPYKNTPISECADFDVYTNFDPTFGIFKNSLKKAITRFQSDTDVVMIYTPHLDSIGHVAGPTATASAYPLLAHIFDSIKTDLKNAGLEETVNVVFGSDHGMVLVSSATHKFVRLEKYLNLDDVKYIFGAFGGYAYIFTMPNKINSVYKGLKAMPGVTVYLKNKIPTKYHLKKSKNAPDILIVADQDVFIEAVNSPKQYPRWYKYLENNGVYGTHAWESKDSDVMNGAMFAWGPDFEPGPKHFVAESVDIYELSCHLAGVTPAKNDGKLSRIAGLLRSAAGKKGGKKGGKKKKGGRRPKKGLL